MSSIVVAALYHFVTLEDYTSLRQPLLDCMLAQEVKGTMLLAREGVNGTIAGSQQGIDAVLAWIHSDPRLCDVRIKFSFEERMPFYRSRVKLKKEIVTMGVEGIDPTHIVGTYVKPEDWNALISDPDVVVVDTRNDYESHIGTFRNAVIPETQTFRQFPRFVEEQLSHAKGKKIAMFCTGGIRCEKSTAYLKGHGFDEVYHLQGGILKYLETVPEQDSMWEGECFVFDNRVSVDHALNKGRYDQCYACRMPITEEDKQNQHYVEGVSCPHCFEHTTDAQRARFAEREKQMLLAKSRGEEHIGSAVVAINERRRQAKNQVKKLQRRPPGPVAVTRI
ncbi:MAG TPA: rhodanese-related sulfurtransferase [Chromatiaceae bacterium]|jgi:UPF0176 protein|nr:rhodanese-related sulfurtransferase [Chromatiaceae bacterium]HIB85273.1 rhodanese-related sulfurtransferase [Chromatiaceae bacterium]HIN82873.1 rhodanese-related sulfurtransferase [Chromatiales bacterium]HIO03007.1 rhodanese-related sulfurtransferase [Alphaproteobacteria bacterium]